MNERMEYKIKRIQRGIKQNDVAKHLNCSSTLLSLFENDRGQMSNERIKQYKQFIDEYFKQ